MTLKKLTGFILLGLFILLTACTQSDQSSQNTDYETTKKMVVDILKTDDGKKAVKDLLTEEDMKNELILNAQVVKDTIEQTLQSEKSIEYWTKLFEDPSFVQAYTKATEDSMKELMTGLLSDSTYKEQLIKIFQEPKMQETIVQALSSQAFKAHLEKTIQETLESPLFKAKMTETLLKAAEKAQQSEGGQGQEQQGGGSGGGGESGGGSDSSAGAGG
ncbi:spore germination lipoprotein GerD [Allobacillus sp. GCM10007491]|uniref:Spore gernimation protein GerD n=1 Tax=Allobacillus saliphilus TaxID=2912308 RepID=A0A941CVI6_9BACI|nr:spore germination lipoprotein GerD [Allobacillus saliphilus]MBR7553896.1 spore gernimation protein GerD [Allobacillus saliphilus]MBR7554840.1 spore gernimation protein GerD [Allobacillus saliphilus]